MNEMRRLDRELDDRRIATIVREHRFPHFVKGFELRFGEAQGEAALWVIFKTERDLPDDETEAKQWVTEANALVHAVRDRIMDAGETRFPYVRFELLEDVVEPAT